MAPVHRSTHLARASGYVLLETVLATGMLIVGLAVLGAMVQGSDTSVRKMRYDMQAKALAEQFLAQLDTGLIELKSVDQVQERSFGPRFPEWGWRLTIDETGNDELYLLTVEILRDPLRRDDEEDFKFDDIRSCFTLRTMRAVPQRVDLEESFGLTVEEAEQLSSKLSGLGIEGLDPQEFDPAVLGKLDFEELIEVLPTLLDAFGMDISTLLAQLPADVRQGLLDAGLGGGEASEEGEENEEGGGGRSGSPLWGQGP